MILAIGAGGGVVGLGDVRLAGLLDDGVDGIGAGSVGVPLEQAVTASSRHTVVRIPLDLCTSAT
ncbi:hypothetical protein [Amycolatopsis sp. NPDC102389]|uniref:hypothetical protein n=1 Tax=Amycolatopsis sp. NPDC102389 TaxID=3363941 RepID=UPI00380B4D92